MLRTVGKILIGLGVLLLLFLGYQLWGTGIVAEQHQKQLASDLESEWLVEEDEPGAPPAPPEIGNGVGIIRIPKIGLDWVVVEGVTVEALKKGPGHMPGTALLGEGGNVVISGHRATYGAPFARFGELSVGNIVVLEDQEAIYTYEIAEIRIVLPTDLSVIASLDEERLTLTTCHPQFSVSRRMIVIGELVEKVERRAAA